MLAWLPQRRRATAVFLAIGVAAAAFWIGFVVGDRKSGTFPAEGSPIAMHPVSGGAAHASVLVGNRDEVGNWPLLVHVSGLKSLPKGVWYELYLTRGDKVVAWCGAFSVKKTGRTTVRFSVPYRLKDFDGWVVTTSKGRPKQQVLLTT